MFHSAPCLDIIVKSDRPPNTDPTLTEIASESTRPKTSIARGAPGKACRRQRAAYECPGSWGQSRFSLGRWLQAKKGTFKQVHFKVQAINHSHSRRITKAITDLLSPSGLNIQVGRLCPPELFSANHSLHSSRSKAPIYMWCKSKRTGGGGVPGLQASCSLVVKTAGLMLGPDFG